MNYFQHPSSLSTLQDFQSYKPTSGINFSYIRYQPGTKKTLYNLYEIGGGLVNSNLLKCVINEKTLQNTVFVITLDLSKPFKILHNLKSFLATIRKIINEVVGDRSNEILGEIVEVKRGRYNKENQGDLKRINIFPAEVVVVGTKYDYLEKGEIEKLKWVCKCLRFFSYINSLSLVYVKPPYNDVDQKQIKHVNDYNLRIVN